MPTAVPPATGRLIRVLTVNTHKGFALVNRRFVLHELREAVRQVGADVMFLQEVQGTHSLRSTRVAGWPLTPHFEFLADAIWPQFAYGRNAVYPHGDHGNAVLSKYLIVEYRNHDVSASGQEARGLLPFVLQRCKGLREVFVQAHGRAQRTFPAHFPLLRLDRIYVRNARAHAPLKLPDRPWSRLSDHSPLAAEIRP